MGTAASEGFVAETAVDGFSFQAHGESVKSVSPTTWLLVSSDGYRAIDEGVRCGEVASELCTFVQHLVVPERGLSQTTSASTSTYLQSNGVLY